MFDSVMRMKDCPFTAPIVTVGTGKAVDNVVVTKVKCSGSNCVAWINKPDNYYECLGVLSVFNDETECISCGNKQKYNEGMFDGMCHKRVLNFDKLGYCKLIGDDDDK